MKAAADLSVNAGIKLAEAECHAADFISSVADSAHETAAAAKRAAKKGWAATEELINDTACSIGMNPFRSVGVTFGIGLGAGILVGWLARRK